MTSSKPLCLSTSASASVFLALVGGARRISMLACEVESLRMVRSGESVCCCLCSVVAVDSVLLCVLIDACGLVSKEVYNGKRPKEVPRLCMRSTEGLSPLKPRRLQWRGGEVVVCACSPTTCRCTYVEFIDSLAREGVEGPFIYRQETSSLSTSPLRTLAGTHHLLQRRPASFLRQPIVDHPVRPAKRGCWTILAPVSSMSRAPSEDRRYW